MKKRIIEWLISKWIPGYHLHLNPVRKASDFIPPMPDFTVEGQIPKNPYNRIFGLSDGPPSRLGDEESTKTSPTEDQ